MTYLFELYQFLEERLPHGIESFASKINRTIFETFSDANVAQQLDVIVSNAAMLALQHALPLLFLV